MAVKILGQSAPAATTATDVYTVPVSTTAIISTITVANRSTTPTAYRIAIRPAGATLANQHYIAYDTPIKANEPQAHTYGIGLSTGDIITVYATLATLTFCVFGGENL